MQGRSPVSFWWVIWTNVITAVFWYRIGWDRGFDLGWAAGSDHASKRMTDRIKAVVHRFGMRCHFHDCDECNRPELH